MLDELNSNPVLIAGGCIAWIIVTGWVMTLVQRLIMGEVDPFTGFMGICLALGLGYMSFKPPVPILQPVSIVALYISGTLIPILRAGYRRHELKSVDVEALEKAYEGFIFRPNNAPAQMRLARHLYNLGVRGHAFVLAENAVQHLPRKFFPEEYRLVEQWRQHPPHKSEFEPIACVECGHKNAPGLIHCGQCGARYLLDRVKGKPFSSALGKKLLAGWVLLVLILVGFPVAATLGPINKAGMIASIVVIALLATGTAFVAFKPTEESKN
jgi:hypothetical protein